MSERCCNVADETAGSEHDVWCYSWDLDAALAAARSEGYAQARAEDIAALRKQAARELAKPGLEPALRAGVIDLCADYLASLTPTQEVPDGGS